jgi:hypothetical protein
MARSDIRLRYGDVDQSDLDAQFAAAGLPAPHLVPNHEIKRTGYQNRIDSNPTVYSTGDLSNRVPSMLNFIVDENGNYLAPNEREADRIIRLNAALEYRTLIKNEEADKKRPTITDSVPVTLPINDVNKLRANHIVYYDNRTGEIVAVISTRNKRGHRFYHRYYISPATPWMRATRGDTIRNMARKNDCYKITINGNDVHWGNAYSQRCWLALPVERRHVAIERGTRMEVSQPFFAPRAYDRPAYLDLPRVAFILSLYSSVK